MPEYDNEECGVTFEHDLRIFNEGIDDDGTGWTHYLCDGCGAEIVEDDEGNSLL